eukprot:CAMPEP_0114614114 /NCGR_PEP_ID=MMETSP0168-20121206/5482_1 /TAXON_ID=95228 ORGANISM="Vannella sp., Strain DIVA3 517/6/12" /NCGR_SAMPLE_ID=MMETSP0168 /ASSEMBLY_ACC=CAM_ASM_000044 /LENGTH=171 /DNA_ID=CAMNT_0001825143 /DNA_START=491 /DNA_END=1006 /DNA_ORIENTATION=+
MPSCCRCDGCTSPTVFQDALSQLSPFPGTLYLCAGPLLSPKASDCAASRPAGLTTDATIWLKLGAISGALAVAMGAFGAHSLKSRTQDPYMLKTWDTAAQYHMMHSIALCLVTLSPRHPSIAGYFFAGGIFLFSGSLYALVLSQVKALGAITPIGGMCFILGWLALAVWGA